MSDDATTDRRKAIAEALEDKFESLMVRGWHADRAWLELAEAADVAAEEQRKKGGEVKRKPQPGRCGICGQAVPFVRTEKPVEWGYVSGHYYRDGKLEKVRCYLHPDNDDTRTPGYGWE